MNAEAEEEWERELFRTAVKIRQWASQPDFPDPTYDPDRGWNLDQFAMHFEPALVSEHKEYLRQLYNPELRPKRTVLVDGKHGREEIIVEDYDHAARLSWNPEGKIRKRLLEPRFRVEGIRPGAYQAEVIPIPLLEILQPVIETSELVERGAFLGRVPRRFEQVRVFRSDAISSKQKTAPSKRGKGRPITYTYFDVADEIERNGKRFGSKAELIRYFIPRLRLISTGKLPKNPPAYRSVSDAIDSYGFMKFVSKD